MEQELNSTFNERFRDPLKKRLDYDFANLWIFGFVEACVARYSRNNEPFEVTSSGVDQSITELVTALSSPEGEVACCRVVVVDAGRPKDGIADLDPRGESARGHGPRSPSTLWARSSGDVYVPVVWSWCIQPRHAEGGMCRHRGGFPLGFSADVDRAAGRGRRSAPRVEEPPCPRLPACTWSGASPDRPRQMGRLRLAQPAAGFASPLRLPR